ncbi:MAG: VanZ family protein [Planctomycetota bacterium]|jgi:VanZ family protein
MKRLSSKIPLVLLIVYWITIFILTHTPIKHISFLTTKVNASDMTLHFLAYFILALLLWTALNSSKKVDWRKTRVWWILLVLICYGLLDEWLQTYTQRGCSVYDFLADLTGAATALILLSIFPFRSRTKHNNVDNIRN